MFSEVIAAIAREADIDIVSVHDRRKHDELRDALRISRGVRDRDPLLHASSRARQSAAG